MSDSIEVFSSASPDKPVNFEKVLGDKEQTETKEAKATEETTETQESAQADTESSEETESDATESDEQSDDKEQKPKKKGGFQKRIERFQRNVLEKENEIAYLKAQLAKQAQPEQVQRTDKAQPETKPKIEDFESMADFIEATADWKVAQKLKEVETKDQQKSAQASFNDQLTKFQSELKEFSKTVDDYEDVKEEVADVNLTLGMQHALLKAKHGPEVLYKLAKNRQELERINGLSPFDQAYEIAMVEAEIKHSKSKPKEVKTQPSAPKPVNPISAKSSAAKKSIYDADIPQEDYEKLRREQMRRRNA